MKKIVFLSAILLTNLVFAQKNNTTNAAMAFKNYQQAFADGNFEQAAKDIASAKEYIDKSSAHETTVNDPKTLMYKGFIYIELPLIAMISGDEKLKAFDAEESFKTGFDNLKLAKEKDPKGRYEDDIYMFCMIKKTMLYNGGIQMFQEEKYEEAMGGFAGSTKFSEIIGIVDSAAYFNAGLAAHTIQNWEVSVENFKKCVEINYRTPTSLSYLTESYSKLGKSDEAEKMLLDRLAKNPGDKDLMIALINVYLGAGEKAKAEKVLTDAIALDPNNVELHYAVATIYEGQERYDEAEVEYLKVLELNPNHENALLGLGAVYFNKAASYNEMINDLKPGDPKEDEYKAKMDEYFKKSLPYLEKADELNPNNKEILNSLKQAYYKLEMTDKFKEVKAKLDKL